MGWWAQGIWQSGNDSKWFLKKPNWNNQKSWNISIFLDPFRHLQDQIFDIQFIFYIISILFPNLYLIILLFIIYISFVLNSYFHILPPLLGRGSHNKGQKGKCSIFLDFLLRYRGSCQKKFAFLRSDWRQGLPQPPIHAKNVWCCGDGYFGQKKLRKKCVNRDKM